MTGSSGKHYVFLESGRKATGADSGTHANAICMCDEKNFEVASLVTTAPVIFTTEAATTTTATTTSSSTTTTSLLECLSADLQIGASMGSNIPDVPEVSYVEGTAFE